MNASERHQLAYDILEIDRRISELESIRHVSRSDLLRALSRVSGERETYTDGIAVAIVRSSRASLDKEKLAAHLGLSLDRLTAIWESASVSKPISPYVTIRRSK